MNKHFEDGFAAIFSVLLLFFALAALTLAVSFAGYVGRMNELEAEYQARGRALARACAESAIIRIAENRDYAGGDAIAFGTGTCSIVSVTSSPDQLLRTIRTESNIHSVFARYHLDLDIAHIRVLSEAEALD